jgi:ADP-heptose:LPS heptosyltransferase/GT2 family glycosyltransferase
MQTKTPLIVKHGCPHALGDVVLFTALIRDIHAAYPGKYAIEVDTNFKNIWWNNPHVVKLSDAEKARARLIQVDWGQSIPQHALASVAGNMVPRHILAWYHYAFEQKTGLKVPVTKPKADLHMDDSEKTRRVAGRYWVVVSGGKLDATVKHWHAHRMQEVVDALNEKGITCVQVGATHREHIHPPLERTLNLVGQTDNVRDLWNVIAYSDGVICGITGAMHIAAAFDKPCVVYAGGREDPWFEAYTNEYQAFGTQAEPVAVPHRYLHSIGKLDCCLKYGCWKNRVVPLDPQDRNRKVHLLCQQPVKPLESHPVAGCQDLITSRQVVAAVMSYYEDKTIPKVTPDVSPKLTVPQVELIEVRFEADGVKLLREPSVPSIKQKEHQKVHPLELKPAQLGKLGKQVAGINDPIIGGKITVCVLCYGPHTNLAIRCLSGILNTVPTGNLDLRVATNNVAPATLKYLQTLPITKIYKHDKNDFKYPVMREMFYDPEMPINTKYLVWFDDDTWIVNPGWLSNLCTTIVDNHNSGFRLYGSTMYHDLSTYAVAGHRPDSWFKSGSWHRGRFLRSKAGGEEVSNGGIIDFAVGWCWAISTDAMREADVPDRRLLHNGGDITIGEQMHQAGYEIQVWNRNKSLVACPSRAQGGRRGVSQRFPWDPDFDLKATNAL